MKQFIFLLILSGFIPTPAFGGEGHAHGPDGSHISDETQTAGAGDVVILSHETEENLGIETVRISYEDHSTTKTLYGRVIADPRRVAVVAARFQGRIEEIFVLPGVAVARNQQLLSVNPIQVGGQSVTLRAPRAGYVTELHVAIGQVFEPTDALLQVSDLSYVLFEGDLFDSSDANNFKTSSSCTIHTKRYPTKHFECIVETIDAVFRGNPPIGHVHARVANLDSELKPGMTGQIHIAVGKPRQILTVPKKAVLGRFEHQFVYRFEDGKYFKTPLRLGDTYADSVEVLSGLNHGAQIVVQGHYQLQFAQSESPDLPEKHAHEDSDDHHDHHHPHDHGQSHEH